MSLETRLGPWGDLLDEGPCRGPHVLLPDPILARPTRRPAARGRSAGWNARRLSLLFPAEEGAAGMAARARRAARRGGGRGARRRGLPRAERSRDRCRATPRCPSLLAVSAVHQHLCARGLRLRTSLVADTGEARDDHQIAALLGFGADAVCPYLALAAIADAVAATGARPECAAATRRYRDALDKGLLKILSKMGISTLRSYRGAQLFEAVGIVGRARRAALHGHAVLDRRRGPRPRWRREVLARHRDAFGTGARTLDEGGLHRYRQRGEAHAYEPKVVKRAARRRARRPAARLRELRGAGPGPRAPRPARPAWSSVPGRRVPLDEVEPAAAILPRFMSAAMSLGALSPEAQQVHRHRHEPAWARAATAARAASRPSCTGRCCRAATGRATASSRWPPAASGSPPST